MEQLHSNCTFCGALQTISSDKLDVFVKHLQNAFLTRNKDCSLEEFGDKLQLCVICAQKIQLSVDLKKSYDEMCNRNNRALPTKCYFCESRSYVLIDTGDNPNDFDRKMKLFHNSVLVHHSYENLCVCTKCLYNLHIWWETRSNLSSLLKIPDTSDEVLNNNNTEVNAKIHRYSNRTPVRKFQRNGKFAQASINKKLEKFNLHLKRKLKRFKSARNIMQHEEINLNGFEVADNDKMFEQIPYVKILVGSQISLETLNSNSNSNDCVVVSDSEDEFDTPPMKICRYSTPLTRISRSGTPAFKKTPFKIKFSSSFSKTLKLPDKSSFVCMVCEKQFSVKCEYLLHLLRHQKVESLIVKLTKHNLPSHINVHDFKEYQTKKTKGLSMAANAINRLLVKYIGEGTANTFKESEEQIGTVNAFEESEEQIGTVNAFEESEKQEGTADGFEESEKQEGTADAFEESEKQEGTADAFEESDESENQKDAADAFESDQSEKQESTSKSSTEMDNNDDSRVDSPTIMHESETAEIFNVIDENRNMSPVIGCTKKAHCEYNTEHQSTISLQDQENIMDKSVDDIEIENSNKNDENGKSSDDCVEIEDSNKNNENGKSVDDCVEVEDSDKNDENGKNLDYSAEIEDSNKNDVNLDDSFEIEKSKKNDEISGKGNDTQINNDDVELSDCATEVISTLGDSSSDTTNIEVIDEVTSEVNGSKLNLQISTEVATENAIAIQSDNQVVSAEKYSTEKRQCNEKQEKEENKRKNLLSLYKPSEPVLTNQELLNILDSNVGIDDSENTVEIDSLDLSYDDPKLQHNRFECDTETPKRKRVRFANQKEIVTPDKSIILLEKLDRMDEDNCIEID